MYKSLVFGDELTRKKLRRRSRGSSNSAHRRRRRPSTKESLRPSGAWRASQRANFLNSSCFHCESMSLSRLCSRITFFTKQSPSLRSAERNSGAAGLSCVTSAQSPRNLLSLRPLVSPVSFTQEDQRLRAAWSISVHLKRMSSSRTLSQMTPCPWQYLMQKSGEVLAERPKSFPLQKLQGQNQTPNSSCRR